MRLASFFRYLEELHNIVYNCMSVCLSSTLANNIYLHTYVYSTFYIWNGILNGMFETKPITIVNQGVMVLVRTSSRALLSLGMKELGNEFG